MAQQLQIPKVNDGLSERESAKISLMNYQLSVFGAHGPNPEAALGSVGIKGYLDHPFSFTVLPFSFFILFQIFDLLAHSRIDMSEPSATDSDSESKSITPSLLAPSCSSGKSSTPTSTFPLFATSYQLPSGVSAL